MKCSSRYVGVIFLVGLSSFPTLARADYIDANGNYVVEVVGERYTGNNITNKNDIAAMARAQSAGTTVFSATQYYSAQDGVRRVPPYPAEKCKADRLSDQKACEKKAFDTYNNSIGTCNYTAIGGAGVAGVGGVGLALLSGPIGWAALGLGALTVGGGVAGAWGATSCSTQKENTREASLRTCDMDKEVAMAKCGG